jgi:hypothetical protein
MLGSFLVVVGLSARGEVVGLWRIGLWVWLGRLERVIVKRACRAAAVRRFLEAEA